MLKIIVALSALVSLGSSAAFADKDPLSNLSLRKSLEDAVASGQYLVRILKDYNKTNTRTVVLLGEAHFKSEKMVKLGNEVIKQFSVIGIEGVDIGEKESKEARAIEIDWANAFREGLGCSSDAGDTSSIREAVMLGMKSKKTIIPIETGLKLSEKAISDINKISEDRKQDIEQFKANIKKDPASVQSELKSAFYWLAFANESVAKEIASTDPSNFFLGKRNSNMAHNISKYFEKTKSQDAMLVIVGKAHIAGLMGLLTTFYGFTEMEFDSLAKVRSSIDIESLKESAFKDFCYPDAH